MPSGARPVHPAFPSWSWTAAGFAAFLDPGAFDTVRPGEDEVAMFLYTSGSTGRPKGVPLSHAGQLWTIRYRAHARHPTSLGTASWSRRRSIT